MVEDRAEGSTARISPTIEISESITTTALPTQRSITTGTLIATRDPLENSFANEVLVADSALILGGGQLPSEAANFLSQPLARDREIVIEVCRPVLDEGLSVRVGGLAEQIPAHLVASGRVRVVLNAPSCFQRPIGLGMRLVRLVE
jgi:hypothetical protein